MNISVPTHNETLLPDCSIPSTTTKSYKLNYEKSEKCNFTSYIKDLLGDDCWAVVLDNEQLFNTYASKSYREIILDKIIRKEMTENPMEYLLGDIPSTKKNHIIDIYMFGLPESYKYRFTYDTTTGEFIRTVWMTSAYMKMFGDDFKSD